MVKMKAKSFENSDYETNEETILNNIRSLKNRLKALNERTREINIEKKENNAENVKSKKKMNACLNFVIPYTFSPAVYLTQPPFPLRNFGIIKPKNMEDNSLVPQELRIFRSNIWMDRRFTLMI